MPFHNHMSQMSINIESDKLCKLGGVSKNGHRKLKIGRKVCST